MRTMLLDCCEGLRWYCFTALQQLTSQWLALDQFTAVRLQLLFALPSNCVFELLLYVSVVCSRRLLFRV